MKIYPDMHFKGHGFVYIDEEEFLTKSVWSIPLNIAKIYTIYYI